MNLKLRPIDDLGEAQALADLLAKGAEASSQGFDEEEPQEGAAARFLERHFQAPETLLVVAEAAEEPGPLAFALTGPLEDPWTGSRWPLLVGLWVRPNIRHRGVARALVQEVGRLLDQRGIQLLAGRTGHNDDALVSMGERWGFVRAWEFLVRER